MSPYFLWSIDIWNGSWAHILSCSLPADTNDIWPVLLLMGTALSAICSTGEASIYEINLSPPWTIWSYQLIHLCLKILATRTPGTSTVVFLSLVANICSSSIISDVGFDLYVWQFPALCVFGKHLPKVWPCDLFTAKSHLFCSEGHRHCIQHNRANIEFVSV